MSLLFGLIATILEIMAFAILARSLLSWFPQSQGNPVTRLLVQITEPILEPLRRIIPRFGMIDLSPLVAMIVLHVIAGVLYDV